MIKNQFNVKIKAFRLDNAPEFKSNKWTNWITSRGIICEYTSPYTPPQNGISERLNRYLVEKLISICIQKSIPLKLWPYILQGIVHIKNRTYNNVLNKTPYEALVGHKPKVDYIKILGSLTYTTIPKERRAGKLDIKANKGILVGFESSNNFLIYLPNKNKVISSRDINIKEELIYNSEELEEKEDYNSMLDFDLPNQSKLNIEDTFTSNKEASPNPIREQREQELEGARSRSPIQAQLEEETSPDLDTEETIEVKVPNEDNNTQSSSSRYPIRASRQEINYKGLGGLATIYSLASKAYITTLEEEAEQDKSKVIVEDLNAQDIYEPKNYKEAMASPYKDLWTRAIEIELDSLKSNNTWDLASKPPKTKVIKTRWVFKLKQIGSSVQFKARFVAKGFEQLYGLDYQETFAAVIKQLAWRLIFALAMLNNWFIYKVDMISAFTQGNIDHHIYITQPEGFISLSDPDAVLKLNKALYGLKQSARIWYFTLKEVLIKLNFKALNTDSNIFINKELGIIICLYVDDLAIIGPKLDTIKAFVKDLRQFFKLKELGLIKDYLGIEINYDLEKQTLKLYQTKYIDKILARFDMNNANTCTTPMDNRAKIKPNNSQALKGEIKWFQAAIGALLFLMLATRPDIAYSVITLARHASNPSIEHIIAIKRIFRYLKGTRHLGITYSNQKKPNDLDIIGYCDADYAGDIASAKSTSGYIFYIANAPFMWKSKLQSIIAQSSTESEYIAINLAAKEAVFILSLMTELGYYKEGYKLPIYTDNSGALQLAKNPVFHERTKHIAVRYHYIRDLINNGILELVYIPTEDQKADGLTKPLGRKLFKGYLEHLGLN